MIALNAKLVIGVLHFERPETNITDPHDEVQLWA